MKQSREIGISVRNSRAYEFEGKTVGLIGVGNIGRIVAQMCMGLGFHIAAYDPFVPEEKLAEAGLPCLQDGRRDPTYLGYYLSSCSLQ